MLESLNPADETQMACAFPSAFPIFLPGRRKERWSVAETWRTMLLLGKMGIPIERLLLKSSLSRFWYGPDYRSFDGWS